MKVYMTLKEQQTILRQLVSEVYEAGRGLSETWNQDAALVLSVLQKAEKTAATGE